MHGNRSMAFFPYFSFSQSVQHFAMRQPCDELCCCVRPCALSFPCDDQALALKCYVITFPLCTCGQSKINMDMYRSSQPAEAGFSQRNVDVVMSWGLAEADGPFRQTLDCLIPRGQRSGESAGETSASLSLIGFGVKDEWNDEVSSPVFDPEEILCRKTSALSSSIHTLILTH